MGLVPASLPHALDTPVLCTPPLPLSQFSDLPYDFPFWNHKTPRGNVLLQRCHPDCFFFPGYLREAKPGCFQTRVFPTFSGKVQIVSRTLSGLFLVGALNRPRNRKRANRENPRRVPGQIGKIPRESPKRTKKDKKGRTSPDRETPPFEPPPFSGP